MNATPMALTDEKGNSVIFNTITNKWTEELARAVTMSCGGSVTVALYIMDGRTMKAYGVKNIVSRSEMLGRAIRNVKNQPDLTPQEAFLKASEGYGLFRERSWTCFGKPTARSIWAASCWKASAISGEKRRRSPSRMRIFQ